jgi:sulfate adenylyltransferase large subunit
MATGASTADLAIILVDARKGLLAQSRRHSFIAWLLGVRKLVCAINKMDLVGFEQSVYDSILRQARPLLETLEGAEAQFIPLSALDGDNVVNRSARMPWYDGPTLLDLLESVDPASLRVELPFRMAVQSVIRPHLDFRGFAGQIASGRVKAGDEVTALPSGRTAKVKRIVTFDGDLPEAFCPMSVTLELDREIDVSRGDLFALSSAQPQSGNALAVRLVWMNELAMEAGGSYLLQHGTRVVPARIKSVRHRWDVEHLHTAEASTLELNDIGEVEIETAEPLSFDSYRHNRATGGLILIDPIRNLTVAAGLIEGVVRQEENGRQRFSTDPFTPAERAALRALMAHMKKFGFRMDDFEAGEGI